MVEIRHRWMDKVLFADQFANSVREAVLNAFSSGADLSGAYLRSADLRSADLRGADLRGANLSSADLGDANLRSADLSGADLGDANLRSADLSGADLGDANLRSADLGDANLGDANLRSANLSSADLSSANLRSADLRGANLGDANLGDANLRSADLSSADLSSADLRSADLTPIRDDLWAVLSSAPSEASALLSALRAGQVDGSTYTGDCACLVGTLANAKMCFYNSIAGLTPDSSRPAEMFFAGIRKGDTPETSQFCRIAADWTEDWIGRMKAAFGSAA